jgi:hypothetical protein
MARYLVTYNVTFYVDEWTHLEERFKLHKLLSTKFSSVCCITKSPKLQQASSYFTKSLRNWRVQPGQKSFISSSVEIQVQYVI